MAIYLKTPKTIQSLSVNKLNGFLVKFGVTSTKNIKIGQTQKSLLSFPFPEDLKTIYT